MVAAQTVKVLLLGYGPMARGMLEALLGLPACEVVGVFAWSDRKGCGHYRRDGEEALIRLVQSQRLYRLRNCPGANSYEFMQVLERLRPDLLLIGSWGEILKSHVLEIPWLRVVNCHPSLLPAYRGANPFAAAIVMGEAVSGVTLHLVDAHIDQGPILLQQAVTIGPHDTGADLRTQCSQAAKPLVAELIRQMACGQFPPAMAQDPARASYFKPLQIEDGRIDWQWLPAVIYNRYRGLKPWLEVYAWLEGRYFFSFASLSLQATARPVLGVAPGTILGCGQGQWVLATIDPSVVVVVSGLRFYSYLLKKRAPRLVSPLLAHWICRPGRAFKS